MVFEEVVGAALRPRSELSYEIWIGEVDASGAKRDARVLAAARSMKRFFLWYRQSELGCPSLANTLAEEAVDHACHALTQGEIRNPRSYLKTAFKHAVDRYLRRERRLIPIDFERESEQTRNEFASEEEVANLERLIQIGQILAAMDQQTLAIFVGRRAGYTGEEIAKRLGVTTSALYTSYCRGLGRVIEAFQISSAVAVENEEADAVERRRKRRPERPTEVSHADQSGPAELSDARVAPSRRR